MTELDWSSMMTTLPPRHCATCARGFVPTSETHLYCGAECKLVGRYQPCRICGNPTTTTRSKATRETKHGSCWDHGTRSGYEKHGCRCVACRSSVADRNARINDKVIRPRTSRACRRCGASFITRRVVAYFCSTECSQLHTGGSRWISQADRVALYDRDDWTCQLCFEPVDYDADWWSDWYPSLDHIRPRATADAPDHSPGNLRTAHRWCNIARGVNDVDEELFAPTLAAA